MYLHTNTFELQADGGFSSESAQKGLWSLAVLETCSPKFQRVLGKMKIHIVDATDHSHSTIGKPKMLCKCKCKCKESI